MFSYKFHAGKVSIPRKECDVCLLPVLNLTCFFLSSVLYYPVVQNTRDVFGE